MSLIFKAMRDFDAWFSNFRSNIADYKYYIDFEKVYNNANALKVELNILNSLIGSKNIESDFEEIIAKYPDTLKCIPILLAKRESEIFDEYYDFYKDNYGDFAAKNIKPAIYPDRE